MPSPKLALRTLFLTPFVTAVAILSLALGVGANAAIFSLFHQMLLRPLPVPHPEQLVNFSAPGPNPGSQQCGGAGDCNEVFSYPMFRDLERQQTAFTGIAAHVLFGANLALRSQTVFREGVLVSGSYFPVLGLRGFAGTTLGSQPHVFVPITMRGLLQPGWSGFEDRRSYCAYLFARRKPGSALTLKLREGRIQSAERAVPTHSRSNETNLLSA